MSRGIVKVCVLFLFVSAQAQQKKIQSFPVSEISIQWQPVQNDYENKPQSLNAITLRNNSKMEFTGSGWKIYFNSARLIQPATVSKNARIDLINGDLFSLTPASDFNSLKPGDSVRIEYVAAEPVVNITDGPEGFYLVWDSLPERGFSLGALSIRSFKPNYKGLMTPEIIFEQNRNIHDIPLEQLTKIFPTPASYKEYPDFSKLYRISSSECGRTISC